MQIYLIKFFELFLYFDFGAVEVDGLGVVPHILIRLRQRTENRRQRLVRHLQLVHQMQLSTSRQGGKTELVYYLLKLSEWPAPSHNI